MTDAQLPRRVALPMGAAISQPAIRWIVGLACWTIAGGLGWAEELEPAEAGRLTTHELRSAHQAEATRLRVLAPARVAPGKRYRTLWVLPVEAGGGTRWGDALEVVRKHQIATRFQLFCVFPEFSALPWYANHPTDRMLGQESYLLQDVLPLVEQRYPVSDRAADRLLIGFSKSGWGAWSLLLRHPEVFGKAAAFDAPLMMAAPGKYGSGPIFGTAENFAHYQVSRLLALRAGQLREMPRLVLLGEGNFEREHQEIRALMDRLKIACVRPAPQKRRHAWDSGWVLPAVEALVADP